MLDWMMTMATHQTMGSNRRLTGVVRDTRLMPSDHALAVTAWKAMEIFTEGVTAARGETAVLQVPMGNPASFVFIKIIKTLAEFDTVATVKPAIVAARQIVANETQEYLAKLVSLCSENTVRAGELTRIVISMKGLEHRSVIIEAVANFGRPVTCKTRRPPAGVTEDELGAYLTEFKSQQDD